jgi:transposase
MKERMKGRFVSVSTASKHFGVSEGTIWTWITCRKVKSKSGKEGLLVFLPLSKKEKTKKENNAGQ